MSEQLLQKLDYDKTFDCVQCGYCLPACPTYLVFGKEKHSPRGRINLVKMTAEGKIDIEDMRDSIELCLGCRACETVCPTKVQYGDILMSAVEVLNQNKNKSIVEKVVRKTAFNYILTSKRMIKLVNRATFLYDKTKVKQIASKVTNNNFLKKYHLLNQALPEAELMKKRKLYNNNKTRLKVAYFEGCIMESFFSKINTLAMEILKAHGVELVKVKQTCCGALQHHAGEVDITIQLAKENIQEFNDVECDFIVNSIGGCGATLKEYDKLFEGDREWEAPAKQFKEKVRDISELFEMIDLNMIYPIEKNVVYQPSCHLENVQKVFNSPLEIIHQIPSLNYIDMPGQSLCCGSAGIYNVLNFDASMQILDMKMKNVKTVKPNLIITSNPGCHMQMVIGVEKEGLSDKIEVKHLVEVVAESCGVI